MCGIVGLLNKEGIAKGNSRVQIKKMADAIVHRGPDSFGEWYDEQGGVALGFRRLAILDLQTSGNQPMISASGQYVIVFNGEIYNHLELKNELKNTKWQGHSDTEVLLEAIATYGLEKTLAKIEGMFAFALWDRNAEELFLVRDRMGEKPLYYSKIGETIFFASELKAIKKADGFQGIINQSVLPFYFKHGYIPAPYSIFENVHKVKQGSYIKITKGHNSLDITQKEYWSLEDVALAGMNQQSQVTEEEALEHLELLLKKSVQQQMISDVPLGAFLSGGIDSSLIVSLMQQQSSRKVKTFSIGFAYDSFNEATYAKEIATYLGTEHTEFYVSADDALNVIPMLMDIYDEPYGDSSALPTYLVSKMARQHVTVALSGDAGDELFFGYTRYRRSTKMWKTLSRIPRPVKRTVASSLHRLPSLYYNRPTLGEAMTAENFDRFFLNIPAFWGRDEFISEAVRESETLLYTASPFYKAGRNKLSQNEWWGNEAMYIDMKGYLPDDILVKVDRAAMANSLETRAPFLNHKLIEYAWRIPVGLKFKDGSSKWILKQVLEKYIPRTLWERPKAGFRIPVHHWLNGPLKEWANDLLSEESIKRMGIVDHKSLQVRKEKYLNGSYTGNALWHVLMFQDWMQKNTGGQ